MSFPATVRSALQGASVELGGAAPEEWLHHATELVEIFSSHVERPSEQSRVRRVLAMPGAVTFVSMLLEPDSPHLELGVALAANVGPNDALEARLEELSDAMDVSEALSATRGTGIVERVCEWLERPARTDEVVERLQRALPELNRLTPRLLGRHGPRLIDALSSWKAMAGGIEECAELYRTLERCDLTPLIDEYRRSFAAGERSRHVTLATLRDLRFIWPTASSWADNVIEFFDPRDDELEDEAEDDGPPVEVSVFRRR